MMDCSFSFADKMDLTSETIGNSVLLLKIKKEKLKQFMP